MTNKESYLELVKDVRMCVGEHVAVVLQSVTPFGDPVELSEGQAGMVLASHQLTLDRLRACGSR